MKIFENARLLVYIDERKRKFSNTMMSYIIYYEHYACPVRDAVVFPLFSIFVWTGENNLFIYLIAFTMITILKRLGKKIHLNKTQKNKGRRGGTHNRARLQIKCAQYTTCGRVYFCKKISVFKNIRIRVVVWKGP